MQANNDIKTTVPATADSSTTNVSNKETAEEESKKAVLSLEKPTS